MLQELGHTQPPTPIHYNNPTAEGIVNGTVKDNNHAAWKFIIFTFVT